MTATVSLLLPRQGAGVCNHAGHLCRWSARLYLSGCLLCSCMVRHGVLQYVHINRYAVAVADMPMLRRRVRCHCCPVPVGLCHLFGWYLSSHLSQMFRDRFASLHVPSLCQVKASIRGELPSFHGVRVLQPSGAC